MHISPPCPGAYTAWQAGFWAYNQADSEERPQAMAVWEYPKGQDPGQAILRAIPQINLYWLQNQYVFVG